MTKQRSLAVRALYQDAEKTRRFLRDQELLCSDLKIDRDGTYVYFPIIRNDPVLSRCEISDYWFTALRKQPGAYGELLDLPGDLMDILPSSYDIVGEIILIKLPLELTSFRENIGVALLTVHRHCRTVCMVDPVEGELRVRSVAVIAGVPNTVTVHREYGLWLKVDVASVYFSPRLASERKRVADLVGDREVVVDLFAGVAPFSIMIAKRGSPSGVIAIDKNPKAVQLAAFNVRRNNVADVVDVVQGDAADVVGLVQGRKANRVIMNLPFGSFEFFSYALAIAAPRCVVHLYAILAEDMVSVKIEELRTCALRCSFELVDVDVRRIKSYAPYEFYMGFDIVAQKVADVA